MPNYTFFGWGINLAEYKVFFYKLFVNILYVI